MFKILNACKGKEFDFRVDTSVLSIARINMNLLKTNNTINPTTDMLKALIKKKLKKPEY